MVTITVGVLALQGAFSEHIQLLRRAFTIVNAEEGTTKVEWQTVEVRTAEQLSRCDALIVPGGESTTISLVAARSGLLEPLRSFVKVERKPTWGTCAGLILLAEAANRTKKGGQELIGGLDVRVNRNHFGRQVESFETDINLSFLQKTKDEGVAKDNRPFKAFFIRAPVVEKILPTQEGIQVNEAEEPDTVVAPSQQPREDVVPGVVNAKVEVLGTVPKRGQPLLDGSHIGETQEEDIVAVRQGNVFGTSFHPELTDDARIHVWWLEQVRAAVLEQRSS